MTDIEGFVTYQVRNCSFECVRIHTVVDMLTPYGTWTNYPIYTVYGGLGLKNGSYIHMITSESVNSYLCFIMVDL